MHPSLDKLLRVLDLEARQGFTDRAVIGGLDGFLEHWRREAEGQVPGAVVDAILDRLTGYGARPVEARRAAVEATIALVGPEEPAAPPAPAARRKRAGPAAPTGREPRAAPSGATEGSGRGAAKAEPDTTGARAVALDVPVTSLKGVGDRAAENLRALGVATVRDLLYHAPARYKDYSQLKRINQLRPGEDATIIATVWDIKTRRLPNNRHMLQVVLNDTTATITCTFFNQPYLERELQPGNQVVVSGKVEVWAGRLTFSAPEWERWDREQFHTGRIVPVYPLTQGVTQRWLRKHIKQTVDAVADRVPDPLPAAVRERADVWPLGRALRALHAPASDDEVERARRRLAFDELLVLQVYLRQRRRATHTRPGVSLAEGRATMRTFVEGLPWALTGDQAKVIGEIEADVVRTEPMTRLLQGDVGCGKTAVAGAAIALCVGAGYQAALMAPTEILADQHGATLAKLLAPIGFTPFDPAAEGAVPPDGPRIARLVGSMKPAAKAATAAALEAGLVDVVVGTHAVIQEHVRFLRLGLAIVDEQHRFGVLQRAELKVRGASDDPAADGDAGRSERADASPLPHMLIMSATPIPRTLAQVLNADLDQSVIIQMPDGRKPVKTYWVRPGERERAYAFIQRQVERGRQAYIVCPLVEESESIDARAATVEFERLSKEVFPSLRLGLLHGRMRPAEKEAVMRDFHAGGLDVLVATTVIEVGVDVPNASVILIDGADRFGLSQLHQLRGRVGRGDAESVCILMADDPSETAASRLELMTKVANGIELAEHDLELRGPGDYFGVRQSGFVDHFRFARLAPGELLKLAHAVATEIVAEDPGLDRPAWSDLRQSVADYREAAERV